MFHRSDSTPAFTREPITNATFVRAAWSLDAIAERDRRDFERSLEAQAEQLNRQPDPRRDYGR